MDKSIDYFLKLTILVSNLSGYEKNKKIPSALTVLNIANHFSVSTDWLITGKEAQIKENDHTSNPKLELAIKTLEKLYNSDDPHLQGWAIVTFEKAFADYIDKKNQQKELSKALIYLFFLFIQIMNIFTLSHNLRNLIYYKCFVG
ncbi:MAG: hypothetical protein KBA38_08470 [Negativicutes bacterium]|nr:hypothetical protein [Negativicutes bacterium]